MKTWFAILLAATGCGGSDFTSASGDPMGCTPGAEIACVCASNANGVQTCNDDGTAYGACVCPSGGDSGQADSAPPSTCNPSTCQAPTHAVPVCTGNLCSWSCQDGFADCDGNAANGCEVDLNTFANCGACGVKCKAEVGVCQNRVCVG